MVEVAPPFSAQELTDFARRVGFEAVGLAPVEPLGAGWYAPHAARFRAWLADGRHAEMAWLAERAEERLVPRHLMPEVRTALVLWLGHRTPEPLGPAPAVTGRIAAYGRGRDYHNVLRKLLRKVLRWIITRDPGIRTYMSIDQGAVLERAFAERAGLGWIGKSAMLISPQAGTFGSLAVMFISRELCGPDSAMAPDTGRCGTCTACLTGCPTGAIVAPGLVESRLCISYWTIEHRGVVPAEIRPLLGDWLFGCDVCQDVCPWNRGAPRADAGRWQPVHAFPEPLVWLALTSEALEASLEGSPLLRARGAGLRRNALIVLANTRAAGALALVESVAARDPDPVVRATAVWAARVLGSPTAAARAAFDPEPAVRAEADSPLPPRAAWE